MSKDKKKILVIEDDPEVIETIRMILLEAGYGVEVAYDGRQGVEKIKQSQPDLLLLDLTMPVMDGWAVLVAVRQELLYTSIPVIILTSSRETGHVEKAARLGVGAYLIKPFEPAELVRAVKHALAAT